MAHLTGARDRGQLILIAGFVLAVTFVALALVLNAAIFTENLATRSESVDASNAQTYQRATENAAREAFHYAHDVNNGTNGELDGNVTDAMADYYNQTAPEAALNGRIVNVSADTTAGTNISGGDGGDFRDANNNPDWDLANDVSKSRQFTVFVSDPSQLATPGDPEFRVIAEDGSDRWVLNMTVDGDVTVWINDSGSYSSCTFSPSGPGGGFWVNVTEQTIDDGSCPGLNWGDKPDTYDLRYENASNVKGRYSLIADGTPVTANYGSDPRARDHLYSMTVDIVYETDGLVYETDVRIAPGERDA
ncbi:MAG: hypothetical protein V5A44_07605 [Haloarculaceae archaeon]